MADKLTRRQMTAVIVGAVPPFVPLAAQAQEEKATDPLAAAREQIRESIQELEEFDLPMSAEPAFLFKP